MLYYFSLIFSSVAMIWLQNLPFSPLPLPSNLHQPICPMYDHYNICVVTRSMRLSRFCIAALSLEAFPCCLYSPRKEPIMLPGWDTWMLLAYQIPLCQLRRAPQIQMSTGLKEGRSQFMSELPQCRALSCLQQQSNYSSRWLGLDEFWSRGYHPTSAKGRVMMLAPTQVSVVYIKSKVIIWNSLRMEG